VLDQHFGEPHNSLPALPDDVLGLTFGQDQKRLSLSRGV
jgi:hypothetical protein